MRKNLDTDASAVVVHRLMLYRRWLQKKHLLRSKVPADILLRDLAQTLGLLPDEVKQIFGRYKVEAYPTIAEMKGLPEWLEALSSEVLASGLKLQ